jgi:signal transduction histidine kinase
VAGGFLFYFMIQSSIESTAKEILQLEQQTILRNIKEANEIPSSNYIVDITPIIENEQKPAFYKHATVKKLEYEKPRHFLNYTFCCQVKGNYYSVVLQHSLLENSSIFQTILLAIILILVCLEISLVLMNMHLMKKNLKPFHETLNKIKNYDVISNPYINLEKVKIDEFNDLNNNLCSLIQKINQDYKNLKEYNENISHEIQTPLAVIRNRLEAIFNQPGLPDEALNLIGSAYNNAIELSKIIRGLTLISKIDNLEFKKEKLNLLDQLTKVKENFSEFFASKNITVSFMVKENFEITINSALADILMNNVFKNALTHNVENGVFDIKQENKKIIFMNSSDTTNEMNLDYKRFKTQSLDVSSTGIGLSIIKKICDTHGFGIEYYSKNKMHLIVIEFN